MRESSEKNLRNSGVASAAVKRLFKRCHSSTENPNVTQPVRLLSFQPHMHLRGKRECLEALYPDNRVEMLNCANSNFGWALVYKWADDAATRACCATNSNLSTTID